MDTDAQTESSWHSCLIMDVWSLSQRTIDALFEVGATIEQTPAGYIRVTFFDVTREHKYYFICCDRAFMLTPDYTYANFRRGAIDGDTLVVIERTIPRVFRHSTISVLSLATTEEPESSTDVQS